MKLSQARKLKISDNVEIPYAATAIPEVANTLKELSFYSSDAIDLVKEYLEETYDLHVVSLNSDIFQEEDPSSYIRLLHGNYIEEGQEYNIIDTVAEFDRIYELLYVLARHNLI